MTTKPVVSVCIANYNGADVIETCIESVLAQDSGLSVEIIVHDDCSSDGSAELIEIRYPEVMLIRSAGNVGFCVSNNRMAAQARGQYLLLLNNDAALFPDAIDTLHKAAKNISRPAILGLSQYDAASGELLDIGSLLDPFLNPVRNKDPNRSDVGMVMGACLWIPKALWDDLDGFPEWFGSIGEDLYLCCRARLAGYTVQALGLSGYRHRVGMSFGGGKAWKGRLATTYGRRALSERNKTYVMVLCYPGALLMLLLPLHLVTLFLEGALIAVIKRNGALWREIYAPLPQALWRARDTILPLRRRIQDSRRITIWSWLRAFQPWPHKLKMLAHYGLPDIR